MNKTRKKEILNIVFNVYEDCTEAKGVLLELKRKVARGTIKPIELIEQLEKVIKIIDR